MNVAEILGSRIQQIRLSKRLTQEDLAFRVDKSVHYISAIERGARSPRITTLLKIMTALDATPNEIFCDFINTDNPIDKIISCVSDMEDRDKAFIKEFIEKYHSHIREKSS